MGTRIHQVFCVAFVSITLAMWLIMGAGLSATAQSNTQNQAVTKLCPGGGRMLFYTGRNVQVGPDQTCPQGRQFTLYVVPQGEPLTAGIVVGDMKETVTCTVVYPPSDTKNYRPSTPAPAPQGRFLFTIPKDLPAHLLNRPVELRFGGEKPKFTYATFSSSYVINPANCP